MKRIIRSLLALASGLVMFSVGVGALPASAEPGPAPKLWQLPPDPYFTALGAEPANVQDSIALYQPYFDQFSWMTFTALNWPATKDGEPDTDTFIGANMDDITVWEHWMNADDMFRKDGGTPVPWGRMSVPYKCGPLEPDKDGTIPSGEYLIFTSRDESEFANNSPISTNMFHEGRSGPLVDQNGVWARFESYVSKPSYDFIVQNKLYSAEGQKAFKLSGRTLQFPAGSMEIKVVWKVLGEDEANQLPSPPYHTRKAVFFLGDNKCKVAQVGLVAMHILTRTAQMPTGIWSTFDHVDNLCTPESPRPAPDAKPPNPELPKQCLPNSPPPNPWRSGSFCNADCMTNPGKPGCAPNQPSSEPWLPPADPTQPGTTPPSQVVRVQPIPLGSMQTTTLFNYLFKQTDRYSVWRNYQLIGTQWILNLMSNSNTAGTRRHEVSPGDGPAPQYTPRMDATVEEVCNLAVPCFSRKCPGLVVPTFLGNPMLETYAQKGASCFGCHRTAKTSAGQDADFSWLLARVRRPTNP